MATLYHFQFCPHSRFVRLTLGEMGVEPSLVSVLPWQWDQEFLTINPSGAPPVFIDENGLIIPGASTIAEYLDETRGLGLGTRRLLPVTSSERVEVRRLFNWFTEKFHSEVSIYFLTEKIIKRFSPTIKTSRSPDMISIRAGRTNLRTHLSYISYLIEERRWLAGEAISYADLAAAAQLSCLDYLGDVPWEEFPIARDWYAKIKSRASFRTLLQDRTTGILPAPHYANLDF